MTMFSNIMSAFFVINCFFLVECFAIYVVLQFFAVVVVLLKCNIKLKKLNENDQSLR